MMKMHSIQMKLLNLKTALFSFFILSVMLNCYLCFKSFKTHPSVIQIPVSANALAPGKRIDKTNFHLKSFTLEEFSEIFVSPLRLDEIDGYMVASPVTAEVPLLKNQVKQSFRTDAPSSLVPRGFRLFTLPAALVEAHEWVEMGSYVDVIGLLDIPESGRVSKTIVQNVKVVSLSPGLSFFCSPQEAEFLTFAAQQGKFSVTLRNPFDHEKESDSGGITISKFLSHKDIQKISEEDDFRIISGREKSDDNAIE